MRFLLAIMLAAACGKNQSPPPPSSGVPGAKPESAPNGPPVANSGADEAQDYFGRICAACHGVGGHGDGPAAASLNPHPRDYTDAAWQASITDDQIKDIILKGGAAVGKSAMMPAQPTLKDKPAVVDGLVKIIRGFKQ